MLKLISQNLKLSGFWEMQFKHKIRSVWWVVQNLDVYFSVQINNQFKSILEEVNLNIMNKVHCIMGKITLKATQMKKKKKKKERCTKKLNVLLSIFHVHKLTHLFTS